MPIQVRQLNRRRSFWNNDTIRKWFLLRFRLYPPSKQRGVPVFSSSELLLNFHTPEKEFLFRKHLLLSLHRVIVWKWRGWERPGCSNLKKFSYNKVLRMLYIYTTSKIHYKIAQPSVITYPYSVTAFRISSTCTTYPLMSQGIYRLHWFLRT